MKTQGRSYEIWAGEGGQGFDGSFLMAVDLFSWGPINKKSPSKVVKMMKLV